MTEYGGWELNKMARELADELIQAQREIEYTVPYTAFSNALNDMKRAVMSRLESALSNIKEYGDYPAWKNHILRVFSRNLSNMITRQGTFIYIEPEYVIGGKAEFDEGVALAREALGLDGRMSKEQAAWFWKNFIYMPAREGTIGEKAEESSDESSKKKKKKKKKRDPIAYGVRLYERTVSARLAVWGDTYAPEWWWLEHGNADYDYAYPNYSGTGFIKRAEAACQSIYNETLDDVSRGQIQYINNQVLMFLENPEMYSPGTILDTVMVEGVEFKLHVTPTRQFGVRRASY